MSALLIASLVACTGARLQGGLLDTPPDFTPRLYRTPVFTLYGLEKITHPGRDVTIYLEGDGHAYAAAGQRSTDSTPRGGLVRGLAARDGRANVAYLARPCQYVGTFTPPCRTFVPGAYWDEKRFAPEIIDSVDAAIDAIKARARVRHVHLVGYSGGGAVAALVAAQRDDVASLVTVAGLLDTGLFARLHHTLPLTGSRDPLTAAARLGRIRQIHYAGRRDTIVPIAITQSFIDRLPSGTNVRLVRDENASHATGWETLSFETD